MTTITVENEQSIQAAINVSHNGDVIFVKSGTYNEQLVLNKQIAIKGKSSKDKPVICLQSESSN